MISLLNPRAALLRALICDIFGSVVILILIKFFINKPFGLEDVFSSRPHLLWPIFCISVYLSWGWLLGISTILRWEELKRRVLFQRIFSTVLLTIISVAVAKWIANPSDLIWLLHRKTQLIWMSALGLWSYWVRIAIRKGIFLPQPIETVIVAEFDELNHLRKTWLEVESSIPFKLITLEDLRVLTDQLKTPIIIIFSQKIELRSEFRKILLESENIDPTRYRFIPILKFFEERQERIPSSLLPTSLATYGSTPWASPLNMQLQLKRLSDVILASLLLLFLSPVIFVASILIWLEDYGPAFYTQKRSGFLGQPFYISKLRTMSVQPIDAPPTWTKISDQRITKVGKLLRKMRIDELPQLINVLTGEMSLIGPRPERPEFEDELEQHILHYRKRHWMKPGLSGWAQVCCTYASNVGDSSIKLSYDLYYLRNFSTWLDFVVLFRTIKTVLKATGR